MLSRRTFLTGAVAALSAPRVAAAQHAGGPPRIGFLFYGSPLPSPEIEAFQKGLTDVGYIEAQNVAVDYRFGDGRPERLPELAAQPSLSNPA
jgi:putative tryptophan/tyrosine transport system substrate-binding protein